MHIAEMAEVEQIVDQQQVIGGEVEPLALGAPIGILHPMEVLDETRIVDMFSTAIEDDSLGIPVHRTGDQLEYAYPVAILAAERC